MEIPVFLNLLFWTVLHSSRFDSVGQLPNSEVSNGDDDD